MRSLAITLLSVFLWLAPAAHAGHPLLLSESYWLDTSARATLGDAMAAPFQPYEGSLTEGYISSALWLKLRIAGRDSLKPLALVVTPSFLRRIELYDPILGGDRGTATPLISGRDAPIEAGNHIGLANGFIIAASPQPRDIFLRVTTTTSLTIDLELLDLDEADSNTHWIGGALSVYVAFLLSFCLWGLVGWALRRELIYGLFALRQLYTLLHTFLFFGLLRYFFADDFSASTRDLIYNLVVVTVVAVVGNFDMRLISEFGASGRIRQILRAVLMLPVISVMLILLGHTQRGLYVNSMIVNVTMLMILLLAFSTRHTENKPHGRLAVLTVRFGYLVMSLVVVVPVLMYQNFLKANVPILKLLFLHSVISTVVLFAILSIRSRQRDLLAQESLLQYQIKDSELRRENERRVEKERFLSMLTHELRNPLSVIRLMSNSDSSHGKAVQKAALEMAKVIERVEQSEKLDDNEIEIHVSDVDVKAFVDDLVRNHAAASRVAVDVPAGLSVATDEGLLRSIFGNLLDNAEKYSLSRSCIRVTAGARILEGREGVSLAVANEVGDAGVPDGTKLFTKYYRSKGAHRQPGSGLGLFLVASWIKALDARVDYETHLHGDGAQSVSFSLWFPR